MKKISKSNPLKVFNDNQAKAYKKAGGAMATYKKTLKKAQYGLRTYEGPVSKETLDRVSSLYPESYGPRAITPDVTEADTMKQMAQNIDRMPKVDPFATKKTRKK